MPPRKIRNKILIAIFHLISFIGIIYSFAYGDINSYRVYGSTRWKIVIIMTTIYFYILVQVCTIYNDNGLGQKQMSVPQEM